ncbi:MAG: hypothetical protein H8E41_07180 [Desulfobulbaceae bacterium]|uniref:Glycerophosphoryl diester phosphodiesterase membrane domain-containing protein n=1 Tax=Candidatus Desulfobia pelagia TaxID=2841692 RepID=A0A8J6NFC7_9BACT|nr:hypothetical protein [Candidatus Desulfobia pelagia]
MDFQKHLENMCTMLKDEFVVFVIGGVLIQFLSSLSLGILMGPLMGGYLLLMLNYLRTGERPRFNDIFCGMQRFGELFPVFFLFLLILLGYFLFIIPGVLMTVWWMYVLFLIVDKRISLADAMAESKMKVAEKGFFMHFVFIILIAVIPIMIVNTLAALIPPLVILQYFLFPLQCGCQASLYLEQFDGVDSAGKDGRQLSFQEQGGEEGHGANSFSPSPPDKDSGN